MVEDDRDNVELLKLAFKTYGYSNIEGITDARQAAALIEAKEPDIVLLDLHMPHMDGYQLLQQISGVVGEENPLPIVVISGAIDNEIRERAGKLGATDFVLKPYEIGDLVSLVENCLATRLDSRARDDA